MKKDCQNILPIDLAPMSNFDKLYCFFINKIKKHTPVACDAKREQSQEWGGKMFGVQRWIVRIFLQTLNERGKFFLLCVGEVAGAFDKLPCVENLNHFGRALQEKIFYQQNALLGRVLPRAGLCAQTPDGTRPPYLVRRCLLQMSEACLFRAREMLYSYPHHNPIFLIWQDVSIT